MPRQTREQIDEEIIDCAALLFARHGFAETSIQRVADAVGYSKSGLLRHYPSKEALQEEVVVRCLAELRDALGEASGQAPGPRRDRTALTALARLAMRRPGFIALLLATLLRDPVGGESVPLQPVADVIVEAFLLDPDADMDRVVRVAGAIGALAVARTALGEHLLPDTAAGHLVDVSYDALGHPGRPGH
ncbi:TetR/AcrR family transcriptional regulator [Planobispora rosea]|nr:TetR/AcrR family transcriptional regulator [Planobispora rosea]